MLLRCFTVCRGAIELMQCVTQVQALAEFGDLPQNVDLIVLQQLSISTEQNYIDVRDCPATLWLESLFLPYPATNHQLCPHQ